jgi:hypothetical protein
VCRPQPRTSSTKGSTPSTVQSRRNISYHGFYERKEKLGTRWTGYRTQHAMQKLPSLLLSQHRSDTPRQSLLVLLLGCCCNYGEYQYTKKEGGQPVPASWRHIRKHCCAGSVLRPCQYHDEGATTQLINVKNKQHHTSMQCCAALHAGVGVNACCPARLLLPSACTVDADALQCERSSTHYNVHAQAQPLACDADVQLQGHYKTILSTTLPHHCKVCKCMLHQTMRRT